MNKNISIVLTNILVLALVICLSAGAYAAEQELPVPSSPLRPAAANHPFEDILYTLVEDIDEDNSSAFTARTYRAPVNAEDGSIYYEITAWTLDQMNIKLDFTDGDAKIVELTLGAVPGGAEKVSVRLPADSELLFPSEDKELVLVIQGYGKLSIPAQNLEAGITELQISYGEDSVKVDPFSGDHLVTTLEMDFEAEGGQEYTLIVPEAELEEEAGQPEG